VEIIYKIGARILKVPINEEYIPTPILSFTIWEPYINGTLKLDCPTESE